jgi:hypothetical protein
VKPSILRKKYPASPRRKKRDISGPEISNKTRTKDFEMEYKVKMTKMKLQKGNKNSPSLQH